ncbi:MAG: hypothetical protein U5O16_23970 [Rhodococcus sp. (in: high G+C Gram-positive bacteria)]|uniref:cytochrome P450 n=1 Tax=Rhodococcus sp. TaxID=1831 RepID=UPI002AD70E5A|nr:hypothetical protein [Rhodococcus sp. (in: high G+C Gram-positive bacteria)]
MTNLERHPRNETGARPPVVDFDNHDTAMNEGEVRERFEDFRSRCPVAHVDRYGGFDLISGYPEIRQVGSARDSFSTAGEGTLLPPVEGLPPIPPLEFDGVEHTEWRQMFDALVGPKVVLEHQSLVRETVDAQIDTFARSGSVDLVKVFTHPVPGRVIGRLVGLDTEESLHSQQLFDSCSESLALGPAGGGFDRFVAFVTEQLESRRSQPREDMLTALAGGSFQGKSFDDQAAVQLVLTLLGGGHHSTAAGLAGLTHHILTHDDARAAALGGGDALARVIDESLRLTSPLSMFARTVVEETNVGASTSSPAPACC